jgi:hypothetical protein
MVKQMPRGKSRDQINSMNFDLSGPLSCKTATYTLAEAIPVLNKVRVQDPFSCKRKRKRHVREYPSMRYHVVVQCRFVSNLKDKGICLSNRIEYFTRQFH